METSILKTIYIIQNYFTKDMNGSKISVKAEVITKEDREREAELAQRKAEAAKKYKFL